MLNISLDIHIKVANRLINNIKNTREAFTDLTRNQVAGTKEASEAPTIADSDVFHPVSLLY